jgi:hypothetical protein
MAGSPVIDSGYSDGVLTAKWGVALDEPPDARGVPAVADVEEVGRGGGAGGQGVVLVAPGAGEAVARRGLRRVAGRVAVAGQRQRLAEGREAEAVIHRPGFIRHHPRRPEHVPMIPQPLVRVSGPVRRSNGAATVRERSYRTE